MLFLVKLLDIIDKRGVFGVNRKRITLVMPFSAYISIRVLAPFMHMGTLPVIKTFRPPLIVEFQIYFLS